MVLCALAFVRGAESLIPTVGRSHDLPLDAWSQSPLLPVTEKIRWFGVCRSLTDTIPSSHLVNLVDDISSLLFQVDEAKAADTADLAQNDVVFSIDKLIEETADVEGEYRKFEASLFPAISELELHEHGTQKPKHDKGEELPMDDLATALVWAFDSTADVSTGIAAIIKVVSQSVCSLDDAIPALLPELRTAAERLGKGAMFEPEKTDEAALTVDQLEALTEEERALLILRRNRELKVHVSKVVFIAHDVRKDGKSFPFFNKSHCNSGNGTFGWNSACHQNK
jgi:hypothetical protein